MALVWNTFEKEIVVDAFKAIHGGNENYSFIKHGPKTRNKCMMRLPKIKLEILVTSSQLEQAVQAISESACNGQIGDGKIFISNIDDVIRIRTGETGDSAI